MMLVVHPVSVVFSSLLAEPHLCSSKQCVQIKRMLFPHLPCKQGWPSDNVLVSKSEADLFIKHLFSWYMYSPSQLPLLSVAILILSVWNTDVRPGDEVAILGPWGINVTCWGWWGRKKGRSESKWLHGPALFCYHWAFCGRRQTNLYFFSHWLRVFCYLQPKSLCFFFFKLRLN